MGRKAGVEFDEGPPDDFDPENPYKDPSAMLEIRDYIARKKWIQIETTKIIREKLGWCYLIEDDNHLQKCKHLVQDYLESTLQQNHGSVPPSLQQQQAGDSLSGLPKTIYI